MKKLIKRVHQGSALLLAALIATPSLLASSHMDAPLIILDPAANTTDVYAFVQVRNGKKFLVTALGVYPHQEPGIGPNKYNFDDNVLYELHLATGDDVAAGRTTITYQFQFSTSYKNQNTVLQSYLGVITNVNDAAQNLTQTYSVTRFDRKRKRGDYLGTGIVPPNNQGIATPFYNEGNNGENPARDGVATAAELDRYTSQSITNFPGGYVAFAGQRDDGFYADIQAVFDLLQLRSPGKDSQGGYNLHMLALAIPVEEIGGDQQVVGVYASTSRRRVRILGDASEVSFRENDNERTLEKRRSKTDPKYSGSYVQVARQGNPLFNEGLVALVDKDLYSRTTPEVDSVLFKKYALNPELAKLINAIVFMGNGPAPETNRTDIAGIFIPDLIKVDLSTGSCRLAGGGAGHPTNPDDAGYSRLGIFGGDTLVSTVQPGFGGGVVPGGWPNGRRFGDDVVDIAVTALISDLRTSPPTIRGPAGDNVDKNDRAFHKVFPYESTPQNGRNHTHP